MTQYQYTVKNVKGERKNGQIKANSQREAYGLLREKQYRVLSLTEVPETIWTKDLSFNQSVNQKDFVIYLRQFSTLLKAGITIVDATNILAKQTNSKVLQKTLYEIQESLQQGNALSEVYEQYPHIFKKLFTNMIRAGEVSGTIADTLERLADYYEKQLRTKQKVMAAMTYPAVIAIITTFVVFFLLLFVVPTFVNMFNDLNATLPAITIWVLTASKWIQQDWWLILLLVIIAVAGLLLIKKQPKGAYLLDVILLKIPIFGTLFQKAAISRMTSTLASLFASSVPILEAIEITEKVVGNEVVAKVLNEGKTSLERGDSLAEPMEQHWVIPPLVTQMIAIGEKTGSLESLLTKVSTFYENEVEAVAEQLKSLIEPVMIVLLASVVGFVVLAIMIPMFDMFNQIH
ncbi:type II secretion system F family protein [Bacillus sp. AFS017336]|uniref:type II secretion system F family protein n=1 Tax=Bacillus sp. AFS017336 TaxID=2033489 RepID=UPI000BEF4402|nr:type II secretion system F family protein [Bacillus sp. AFS017336]PEL13438.1 type II secretion system protein F [Bacillus sp. AFS017336]